MLVLVFIPTRLVHTVLELVFAHTVLVVRALQTAPEPPLTTYLMLSTAAPFVGVWQQHFFVGMLASCFFDLQATAYYCCTLCPGICQYSLMDSFELYLELIWPQLSFLENWWWHNTDEQWSEATWHILHKSYSISSSLSHMTNTDIFFFSFQVCPSWPFST